MARVLLKEFKNGNRLWGTKTVCAKCSGTGKVIWSYADHVCFDCDGKGWYFVKETEYTAANLAKLEAKRAKEAAKREAERAAFEAEQAAREAAWRAEEESREAKRRGHYVYEVGEKVEIEVTFVRATSFSSVYGVTKVHLFDTDDGAHLVWKTGSEIGGAWGSKGYKIVDPGDRIKIRATIKAHKEYSGIEQTELTRVKLLAGGRDPEY